MPDWLTVQTFVSVHVFFIIVHVILLTVAYLIYVERKAASYIQDRVGPNRVGFDFGLPFLKPLRGMLGLGQPLADGLKFLLKEDYAPDRVDKKLFTLAPMVMIVPALIGFAIIPWGGTIVLPDLDLPLIGTLEGGPVVIAGLHVNVGVIYLISVATLSVYGVTLGGWASNNKYSFIGGLRCTAQMISYEIPLGLCILATLLLVGSFLPEEIIGHQRENGWLIFAQPLAAIIFFIALLAESNRIPFDNAEAEQELVGGYHTEYSSMRFALFFLAEYAHMITGCAFFTLLFLGGYELLPFVSVFPAVAEGSVLAVLGIAALKFAVFFGKVLLLVCFMILIRWSIPRLRYDQVMMMGWQAVIPISLVLVVLTSTMVYLGLGGVVPMFIANAIFAVLIVALVPVMPRTRTNRRLPLYGSRFCPVTGAGVQTGPTDPLAREDRPVQGTATV